MVSAERSDSRTAVSPRLSGLVTHRDASERDGEPHQAIARRMVEEIHAGISASPGLTDDELDEVRAAVETILRIVFCMLVEDRGPSREEEEEPGPAVDAQEFYARLLAAFGGYRRPMAMRFPDAARRFFDELLAGGLTGESEISEAASACGYVLRAPCAVLAVVPVHDRRVDLRDGLGLLRESVPGAIPSPMLTDPCRHAVVLVPLGKECWCGVVEAAARQVEAAGLIVVAEPAPTLSRLGGIYRGMRRSLDVAGRLRPQVLRAVDLGMMRVASLLTPEERFVQINGVLGKILARRADYAAASMETLRVLRKCRGNVKLAAKGLGVTRKAIYDRLRGIQERSGLRLDNPRDLAVLGWVVSLYWIDGASLPPPGDLAWGCHRPAMCTSATLREPPDEPVELPLHVGSALAG